MSRSVASHRTKSGSPLRGRETIMVIPAALCGALGVVLVALTAFCISKQLKQPQSTRRDGYARVRRSSEAQSQLTIYNNTQPPRHTADEEQPIQPRSSREYGDERVRRDRSVRSEFTIYNNSRPCQAEAIRTSCKEQFVQTQHSANNGDTPRVRHDNDARSEFTIYNKSQSCQEAAQAAHDERLNKPKTYQDNVYEGDDSDTLCSNDRSGHEPARFAHQDDRVDGHKPVQHGHKRNVDEKARDFNSVSSFFHDV